MKAKQTPTRSSENRIPIVPFMSWLSLLTYVLFFILTGTNNSSKGEANFLFGFGWFLFGTSSLFYLMKFISLGHRLVPRKHFKYFPKTGDKLSKMSSFGRIGFFCLSLTITMCIIGLIFPEDYLVIRAANGFYASFLTQLSMFLYASL